MASYNTSVTESIKYLPVNLSASEGLTVNIDNPGPGSSYVVFETRQNENGGYTEQTPKYASGSYTLTNVTKTSDDYKAGFVVAPGGGSIDFTPAIYVSGSDFRVRGTSYHPFYDALLDRWPNAAAAYSLRRLNSYYDGPAIRVRRSIDDEERNIFFSGGQLDTTTLTNFTKNVEAALPGDYGDGPAAAYSLRYVVSSYTGPVIKVRRSSDDTEQDFTPSQITDGILESFCGAGDGFVSVWYDQSGNGYHAIQTSDASQPQIVSSGSVITENEKPCVQFDGMDDSLDANSLASIFSGENKYLSNFSTWKSVDGTSTNTAIWSLGNSATNTPLRWLGQSSLASYEVRVDERDDSNNITNTTGGDCQNQVLNSFISDTDNKTLYNNSTSVDSDSLNLGQITLDRFSLGCLSRTNKVIFHKGITQEIILYPSDQSSNRTDIESNINNYYNIFPFDSYVKTWYDQSGNGYDASQTTAANQPQIVSSGSVIVENEKPALQFINLNNTSLQANYSFTYTTTFTLTRFITRPAFAYIYSAYGQSRNLMGDRQPEGYRIYASNNLFLGQTPSLTNQDLIYALFNSSNSEIAIDGGSVVSGNAGTYSSSGLTIGSAGSPSPDAYLNGIIQEAIFYPSDQSTNRTDIESNINSHYNIY